ncbi:metallophosphoesterase [Alteromonas phage vB_AmeM_PT11-V22]|uniref:Metallophosphoesterase n=1 Tax=Alteromonas phage vB_AmeM_PT11-V22 TaxID=2704031 RepID=A0A6C0R1H4_9CAUD|nr:metallophosphoesterase [Alteromonas phage vB_AmeM_PT11-V22]QHZ59873.1 metallophosphoesterase [Alteromonas phage vB_AmeM_PT11-V22]
MSRLMLMSDLHLGHKNICKYRSQFSTPEEHDNTIFENLATNIRKRDTLYLLGDVAFTFGWLEKIKSINCRHKLLVCGNHDTERGIKMKHLVDVYDDVVALTSKRKYWISHCPIHPQEMRGRLGCVHGHIHSKKVMVDYLVPEPYVEDWEYLNACVEHTNYKPITFDQLIEEQQG